MKISEAKTKVCPYSSDRLCCANKCMAWRASQSVFIIKGEAVQDRLTGRYHIKQVEQPAPSYGYCSKFGEVE